MTRDELLSQLRELNRPDGDIEIHLQSITVSRQLNEDGIETYSVEYNGDVGWLEGLGLLEAAKFDLYEQCRRDDDE